MILKKMLDFAFSKKSSSKQSQMNLIVIKGFFYPDTLCTCQKESEGK